MDRLGLLIQKHKKLKEKCYSEYRKGLYSGKIKRPETCSVCGCKPNRIHGHHVNYYKPLDVVWVCSKCHAEIHRLLNRLEERKKWYKYVKFMVKIGDSFYNGCSSKFFKERIANDIEEKEPIPVEYIMTQKEALEFLNWDKKSRLNYWIKKGKIHRLKNRLNWVRFDSREIECLAREIRGI